MPKMRFRPGLRPRPRCDSWWQSPDPRVGWGGDTPLLTLPHSVPSVPRFSCSRSRDMTGSPDLARPDTGDRPPCRWENKRPLGGTGIAPFSSVKYSIFVADRAIDAPSVMTFSTLVLKPPFSLRVSLYGHNPGSGWCGIMTSDHSLFGSQWRR